MNAMKTKKGKIAFNVDEDLMKVSPALAFTKALMQGELASAKPKRKPLLVDEFIASPLTNLLRGPDGNHMRAVRDHLIEAKKFVLDDKAAVYAAEMIRDYPIAIARDQEFAIPPFPRMYIELPYQAFFKTINGQDTDTDGDTDVGYFIDGPRAYVLSRASSFKDGSNIAPMVMPVRYRLNEPLDIKEELALCENFNVSRMGLDVFYWGSVTPKVRNDPHIFHALRENHGAELWYGSDIDMKQMFGYLYKSAAGDLRNVLALILFLNRTSQLRIEDNIGFHRTLIHNKPMVMTKHSVVKIKLDPKPMLKRIYGTGSAWRRRHDVRGHFCHDKDAREAAHHPDGHVWSEYGVNQWRCMNCAGRKWWRKVCSRGSRDKGNVVTTYEVTK